MASIGQLVRVVADLSGMDEASVKLVARYLREAGLIAQRSTGAGSARMGAYDAAALLMAVNGSTLAKDSVETVREFSLLKLECIAEIEASNPEASEARAIFEEYDIFRYVLAELIVFFSKHREMQARVEFIRPAPKVLINLVQLNDADGLIKSVASCVFSDRRSFQGMDCDRSVSVSITHRTLIDVAATLAN